jgi:hypothetical protein
MHLRITVLIYGTIVAAPAAAQNWVQQGPSPTTGGQVEGMSGQGNPVAGSINFVLAHPTNANILTVGASNGGIWTTTNALSASPTWTARSQQLPSLSIGTLAYDLSDASFNTIWASTAQISSFGESGRRVGVYRSTDGGATWNTVAGNSTLGGAANAQDIVGLVARGNTIVTAARYSNDNNYSSIGIFRSTNGGASFTQVSGAAGSGLVLGRNYDLAGDPGNLNRLYTAVTVSFPSGTNGFYRSLDAGATWSLTGPTSMNTDIAAAGNGGNVKIAVGASNSVYLGTVSEGSGTLTSIWRSGDGGSNWVELTSLPLSDGLGIHPGQQGNLHFSMTVDATNPNIIYVAGDRQPAGNNDTGGFGTHDYGATNYTGRLFRGDITNAALGTVVWTPITHNPDGVGGAPSAGAPHADSRRMTFDASGRLIEVDDGGIYTRSNPTSNFGAWTSLNGNLQVAEAHSAVWDRKTNTIIAGTQDTGTVEQVTAGGVQWRTVSQGDGGRVAVDNANTSANSFRYTSFQFYGGLQRREYNASNTQVGSVGISLASIAGSIQFYGPLETNKVVGGRLYVATDRVYESTNATGASPTFTLINSNLGAQLGASVNVIAAGGRLAGVNNPDVLYAGTFSVGGTGRVFLRTTAGGIMNQLTAYNGSTVRDIAMNPEDWQNVYVVDNNQVFRSTNAGGAFTDITGNLPNVGTMEIQTVEYVDLPTAAVDDVVLIGGRDGVFYSRTSNPFAWFELGGSSMPNVPVFELQYVAEDDVLMAATLGRGIFTLSNFTSFFQPVPEPSTWACIGLAGGVFWIRRRNRKAA